MIAAPLEEGYERLAAAEAGEPVKAHQTDRLSRLLVAASGVAAVGFMTIATPEDHHFSGGVPMREGGEFPTAIATAEDPDLSEAQIEDKVMHALLKYVAFWKKNDLYLVYASVLILCYIFLGAAWKQGLSGFTNIARMKGFCCPGLFGCASLIIILSGPILVLCGVKLSQPLVIIGGSLLVLFWLMISTVLGHMLPQRSSSDATEKMRHKQASHGNLSLMGFFIYLIGLQLALITKTTPYLGKKAATCRHMAFGVQEAGLVLAMFVFLMQPLLNGVSGFSNMARYFHICCCYPVLGLFAVLLNLCGSVAIVVAPFIPKDLAIGPFNAAAFASIVGAKCLILFLLFATLFGHILPGRKAEGREKMFQKICTMRNISIIGGLLFVVAVNVPYL